MSCLRGHLERLAPEIERELKPRLQGLIGAFVRAYLPQQWQFASEEETVTVLIGADGSVKVEPGATAQPDVTVRGSHARLASVLATRTRPKGPVHDVVVEAHTAKGRGALAQVRSRFGF